jgi:hypothetical protein
MSAENLAMHEIEPIRPRALHLARWLPVAAAWLALAIPAWAVTSVQPFGVNVRATGPTTVFLTFRELDPGETALESFWCGELAPALIAANPQLQLPFPVQTTNPCVPGTVFGRLPARLDRARPSTSGALTNLTDIMAIPASVARRAFQDAQAGANSAFLYVRRFTGPAGERFVIVTCRMAGGGARTPLSLTEVRLAFAIDGVQPAVLTLGRGEAPPRAAARIRYNGNGVLRGRWELVQPGDPEPELDDLLTEATLPVEQRAQQRRWALVERFERILPPNGELVLMGPDPSRLPIHADGPYKLLLRIEATEDKEGNSDTGGARIAFAGGVAAFPMPVLRLAVGAALGALGSEPLLLTPAAASSPGVDTGTAAGAAAAAATEFSWVDSPGAALLRVEVRGAADNDAEVLSALVRPGVGRYAAPPWVMTEQRGKPLRWRVVALGEGEGALAASPWRALVWP